MLGDQFLSEAYYRADDDYQGRTTVPALIDTTTGKVVNNDYNWLTTQLPPMAQKRRAGAVSGGAAGRD